MTESDLLFPRVLLLVGALSLSLLFVSFTAWRIGLRLLRSRPKARGRRLAPWLTSTLPLLGLVAPYSLVLHAYLDQGGWYWESECFFDQRLASDYPVHQLVAFLLFAVASWGAFFASIPLFVVYWRAGALDWRAPIAFAVSYAVFLTWIAVDPDGVYDWFATWDFP